MDFEVNVWPKIKDETNEGVLQSLLYKYREHLKKLYKRRLEGRLKDVSKIKKVRKNIARILTKINELKRNNAS